MECLIDWKLCCKVSFKFNASNDMFIKYFQNCLSENPILCDEALPQLVYQMDLYQTKLTGIAHCIVPKLPVEQSVLLQPPIQLLPQILNSQLPIGSQPIMIPPPSIVQIIVPASLQKNTLEEGMEHQNDQQKLSSPNMEPIEHSTTTTTTPEPMPEIISPTETHHLLESQNTSNHDTSLEDTNNKLTKNSEHSNDIPMERPNYNVDLIEPDGIPDVNQKI